MPRFQFNLRQLLIGIVLAAIALLLIRFAIQSHGAAVALLVVAIATTILLVANATVYGVLRGLGLVFGMEPQTLDEPKQSTAVTAESDAQSSAK